MKDTTFKADPESADGNILVGIVPLDMLMRTGERISLDGANTEAVGRLVSASDTPYDGTPVEDTRGVLLGISDRSPLVLFDGIIDRTPIKSKLAAELGKCNGCLSGMLFGTAFANPLGKSIRKGL